MNKIITLCFLCFFFGVHQADAQYVVSIPANAIVVTTDSSITLTPGSAPNYSFLVCPGKKLTLKGISTYLVRVYLEENATLNFDSSAFSLYLMGDYFMKKNSLLDFNKHMGSPIDTLMIQSPASVIDTLTVIPSNTLPCTTLSFDYSLLPGGTSPCAPTGTADWNEPASTILIPSLVSGELRFISPYKGSIQLMDGSGRIIRRKDIHANDMTQMPLDGIAPGVYYYRLTAQSGPIQRGKIMIR